MKPIKLFFETLRIRRVEESLAGLCNDGLEIRGVDSTIFSYR